MSAENPTPEEVQKLIASTGHHPYSFQGRDYCAGCGNEHFRRDAWSDCPVRKLADAANALSARTGGVTTPNPRTIVRTIQTAEEFGGGGEYGVYMNANTRYTLHFWSDGSVTWADPRARGL